jgi:hypothetical protein
VRCPSAVDDRAQLERLELWARASAAEQALVGMTDPAVAAHVASVLVEAKAQTDLAALERWADSQPPPTREDPHDVARSRWDRANQSSYALSAAMKRLARDGCGVCWACQAGGSCVHT